MKKLGDQHRERAFRSLYAASGQLTVCQLEDRAGRVVARLRDDLREQNAPLAKPERGPCNEQVQTAVASVADSGALPG